LKEFSAILTIAYRDFLKFLRDRTRIIATFVFPIIFIGVLGQSLQSNVGTALGYNYLVFTFTGVLAQTLFQSAASGVISLIEDRESDFSQEIFVAPISRYSILFGKILGESAVALAQGLGIIIFGLIIGIPLPAWELIRLLPVLLIICLFGGAFGIIVLSNLSNQRTANQIFPFIIFPQFFLAGVFTPIKKLPLFLNILSRISPMTYAVDFLRGIFYAGKPEYSLIVLFNPLIDLLIIISIFLIFMVIGTSLFVRNERNR
jgi:ABC-2 type transport system permease protein